MRRFRYIGPCRCGMGPHAFYEDTETGEIKHAWEVLGEKIGKEGVPFPVWPGGRWGRGRGRGPGWGGWWWFMTTADEETREKMLEVAREVMGEGFADTLRKFMESVSTGEASKEDVEELKRKLEELEQRLREMEEKKEK